MNITSNVLKALALGVMMAGVQTCGGAVHQHDDNCSVDCKKSKEHASPRTGPDNCPACGMG